MILEQPETAAVAHCSYPGGPECEFVIGGAGSIHFRVIGDRDEVWAGPDIAAFRRIAAVWNRYQADLGEVSSQSAEERLCDEAYEELAHFGAFAADLPPGHESFWSLLMDNI